MRSKLNPTGVDVAFFLGRQYDSVFVTQCDFLVENVRAAAESYTRGEGFSDDNTVPADLFLAIMSKTARMAQNPQQYTSESVDTASSVDMNAGDWNMGERRILNTYRQRTT